MNLPPKSKSVQRAAKSAQSRDVKTRNQAKKRSLDSFVNFAQNMGVGADNPLSTGTYGFNPITRNRILLEWIHRGSWLGGIAVDVVADDMTRAGVDLVGKTDPDELEIIESTVTALGIWEKLNEAIQWSRLYGGSIAVLLLDGQDMSTPLRLNTIRQDQFKGLTVLDRWMVEPSLNDLVTELGPDLGLPKFYTVTAAAPALARNKIHYSRVIRLGGIKLPHNQALVENLWGISVIERLYDRMIGFDSASTGAAQLVYKAFIRTYKVKDMREIVAAGGEALSGLIAYTDMMRRYQGIEGMTLMDADDEYEGSEHSAFSGLSDALQQLGQQLSGALQIPLVRLFGQSPAGFSTGDSDMRNYYDTIKQQQEKDLRVGVMKIYKCIALSKGISFEGVKVKFASLWQLSDVDKSTVASNVANAVGAVEGSGVIDRATALKELRQSSRVTGIFTNISDEMIEDAEMEGPPDPETDEDGDEGEEPSATPKKEVGKGLELEKAPELKPEK